MFKNFLQITKTMALNKKLLSVVAIIGIFAPLSFSSNGVIGISLANAEIVTTVVNNIVAFIAIIPVLIGTFLLFISGLVLDITITETVLRFASFANTEGLNAAWRTFRDLGNIFIVFVLLTISIATIIGNSTYGLKALLAKVIIVALLLNFSLFFTKFVIEITNRLSVEFYSKIVAEGSSSGISAAFMQKANLNSFWDFDKEKFQNLKTDEGTGRATIIVYGIFVGIFFSITAAVFIFASFLLITRAVVLSLLMILSPLAFVAYTLPDTKKHASAWWDALSRNAIFAPIFLILMWATFQVADTLPTSEGSFSSVFLEKDPDTLKVVFSFAIIIGLAVSSIVVAQKLSISGGAGAMKGLKGLGRGAAGLATRRVGGVTFGAAAAAGRNTFGRGARSLLNSPGGGRLREVAGRGGIRGAIANLGIKAAESSAKGSFDARGTSPLKSATKAVGVDLGAPKKKVSYDQNLKESVDRAKKGAKASVQRQLGDNPDPEKEEYVIEDYLGLDSSGNAVPNKEGRERKFVTGRQREIAKSVRDTYNKSEDQLEKLKETIDELKDKVDKES